MIQPISKVTFKCECGVILKKDTTGIDMDTKFNVECNKCGRVHWMISRNMGAARYVHRLTLWVPMPKGQWDNSLYMPKTTDGKPVDYEKLKLD